MPQRTAYDYRERLQPILGWSDDDLRQIPIWDGGEFDPEDRYFNLNLPERGDFRGQPPTIQRPGTTDEYLYVAKSQVPDRLWLRLVESWGSDVRMGNQSPTPGAHGEADEVPRVGRSDTDSLVHVEVPDR